MFVRFYGLRFGILHPYARPDELPVIGIGKDFLTGDLNPRFWAYPSLYMYVLAALDYALWIVIPDTANAWGACSADVRELAAARYDVQHVIKAMDLQGNLFDQQDALVVSVRGLQECKARRSELHRLLAALTVRAGLPHEFKAMDRGQRR